MNPENNKFSEYKLSASILESLTLLGYTEPTNIQQEVIPVALEGKNIIAKSLTGTGKTAAFAIPLCEKADWDDNLPRALVLEPTRELAVQVRDEVFHIGRKKRLKVPAVFGGFPIDKQILTLKQKTHIVVGTPGRVLDHIHRASLQISQIGYLVIDEADLMLDMGFWEEVKEIISLLPTDRKILLFSATLDEKIKQLTKEYMKDAVSILLESKTETVDEVEQIVCEAEQEEKYGKFIDFLICENPAHCMIFCGTREMVNVLYRKLQKDKISCGMIHGELEQSQRLRMIDAFRTGQFRFLIATDVASRGIDFEEITHVINYDFPTGREAYVHRVGRTARNGKGGKAISLVSESEKKMLHMVEEYIGKKLPLSPCPTKDEAEEAIFWAGLREKAVPRAKKGDALNRTILRLSIGGGRKSKMRTVDIVGSICNIEDVVSEDIGIIDVRESLTYVEILNGKGQKVLNALQSKPIKGKIRKVRITRNLS